VSDVKEGKAMTTTTIRWPEVYFSEDGLKVSVILPKGAELEVLAHDSGHILVHLGFQDVGKEAIAGCSLLSAHPAAHPAGEAVELCMEEKRLKARVGASAEYDFFKAEKKRGSHNSTDSSNKGTR
jgi:hypothetical protein